MHFYLINASWAAQNRTFVFINASGAVPNSTFVFIASSGAVPNSTLVFSHAQRETLVKWLDFSFVVEITLRHREM